MDKKNVRRSVSLPNQSQIARYSNNPQLGPRLLFFTGGSALNPLCRTLVDYTHNSIHLITPFDSGGSSAALRHAFSMPAVGDFRSRLLALSDNRVDGSDALRAVFRHRLPKSGDAAMLRIELDTLTAGTHPLTAALNREDRTQVCRRLQAILTHLPVRFDLCGASIGNLIMTGIYLDENRQLGSAIDITSQLLHSLGTVKPIVDDNLHLAARLTNGETVVGQHRLTGKEHPPIAAPVFELHLSACDTHFTPLKTALPDSNRQLIRQADLICYPPGSFYSSVVANLLPEGVASAIADNPCRKVFIPNLGNDPECIGMSTDDLVQRLLDHLHDDVCNDNADRFINTLLLDSRNGHYPTLPDPAVLQEMSIELVDTTLVSAASQPYYDARLLTEALLSLS